MHGAIQAVPVKKSVKTSIEEAAHILDTAIARLERTARDILDGPAEVPSQPVNSVSYTSTSEMLQSLPTLLAHWAQEITEILEKLRDNLL